MVKVIIVDDEKAALDELSYLLSKDKEIEIVGMYSDPIEALEQIDNLKPDAALLDINMPVLNGLNLAREIYDKNSSISILFITASDDHAVQAFELHAIDYVLKPIRTERLNMAIDKIRSNQSFKPFQDTFSEKLNNIEIESSLGMDKIVAFDGEDYNVIGVDDVLFIEVQAKDTLITTKNRIYKTRKTLDLWEKKLCSQGFFRCHRSFLINLKHINKLSPMFNNNYIIKQNNSEQEIPVSKTNVKALKELLDF